MPESYFLFRFYWDLYRFDYEPLDVPFIGYEAAKCTDMDKTDKRFDLLSLLR